MRLEYLMARTPRSTANYPTRFRSRLEAVAKAKAEREGRPCPRDAVVTICIHRQLPKLEEELGLKSGPTSNHVEPQIPWPRQ